MEIETRDFWIETIEQVTGLRRDQLVGKTPLEIYQALCASPVWVENKTSEDIK
jgi:hypothetical protein